MYIYIYIYIYGINAGGHVKMIAIKRAGRRVGRSREEAEGHLLYGGWLRPEFDNAILASQEWLIFMHF